MLNPDVAADAKDIVAAYLMLLEDQASADVYPAPLTDLPHPKEAIRAAFRTTVGALRATDQFTPEMRDYLEIAYVSLADYVNEEGVALLREYAGAGQALAAGPHLAREKVDTEAWRRLAEQSHLAGRLAQAISLEADRLRAEFRAWHAPLS